MTCDFTSFSTAFQLSQDDGWVIIKAVCNVTLFTVTLQLKRSSPKAGNELGTSSSVGQCSTY